MDLTRTAVNSFATHCSKLKPEIEGSALKSLEKTLQHKPNYFMDTTKFIKRLATYVAVEHTAFIIPIEDEYQEVRERENHKRAVTKEYTELDGTRRTRRQL